LRLKLMLSIHDEGTPEFIYHVVQVSVWNAACEAGTEYYPPTYDSDGFIHATHDGALLVSVLNHFYTEIKDDFLCLELATSTLSSPVKMEAPAPVGNKASHPGGQEGEDASAVVKFPHIFGPITPLSCVTRKMPVARAEDGAFLHVEGL
jgi:uncharacterized protein (DUF952 family)